MNTAPVQQELRAVEAYVARVADQLRRAEGARDKLLLELTDIEGAESGRHVAVR